jgi:hypothetical protein
MQMILYILYNTLYGNTIFLNSYGFVSLVTPLLK